MNSRPLNVHFVIIEVPEKRLAVHIFLSGQGSSCHISVAADKTLELGPVNDLAFNTPVNNRIHI